MNWEKYLLQNQEGLADFHTHTTYCDGNATPEEMIKSAISKGLKTYGFSGHGYTFFDESYCMLSEDIDNYQKEIRALADKYKDKLEILCGVEQDCLGGKPNWNPDYVIGSVHYIKCEDTYIPVDETPEILLDGARTYFNGDIYALVSKYYDTIGTVYDETGADILGHFDLISKFNKDGEFIGKGLLFDEEDPRYVKAWQTAADKLLKTGILFEINTGAISRGLRRDAYPAKPIRDYLQSRGGKFIMSSDSHNINTICFDFDNKSYRIK